MNTESHKEYLIEQVEHFDITTFDATGLVDQYSKMAFQARNLARAAIIYKKMLSDKNCTIILTLAGSLFSAGLKKVVCDLLKFNMVDAIVSTGAIIVDQDFFEALGFKHFQGSPDANDNQLMNAGIDRIYDTFISEDELKVCDKTIADIADNIEPNVYSSREFIGFMGEYLENKNLGNNSAFYLH